MPTEPPARGRILVTGASGFIGRNLVPRLLERGLAVRLMSRRPREQASGVETAVGDVLRPDSLRAALEGCSTAYYLVHSMGGDDDGDRFIYRDRRGAENFITAAQAEGVGRIVYLGAIAANASSVSNQQLSPHLASRVETGKVLLSSAVPTTVFGAAMIVGRGGVSFEMLRLLVERLPIMVTPRWLETRTQPIALTDVLAYLVRAPEVAEAVGEFDIGGPEVLSYQQMMARFATVAGIRQPLVVKAPVLTPKLSALWVDLVTRLPKGLTHPLLEGLRNELIADTSRVNAVMPIELTSFDDAIRAALDGDSRIPSAKI